MALRMTLRRTSRDVRGGYITQEFDVDLYSENEFDFVEYDLESMDTAQSLGFTDYDPMLEFYDEYTEGNGFFKLVSKQAKDVYNALEEQGYESFNEGDFSPEQFSRVLADVVMSSEQAHRRAQALYLLDEFVDLSGEDTGYFSAEEYRTLLLVALAEGIGHAESIIKTLHPLYYMVDEEGVRVDEDGDPTIDYDEDYVNALISGLKNAEISEVDPILNELMLFIDRDDVDYTETDDTPYGSGWDSDETRNVKKFKHKISILGKTVFEWDRIIESEIYDPIGFYSTLTDYSEHSDEYKTPDVAKAILSYFEIEESEYDEDDIAAPDPPEHPEPDNDGEFAVLYTRYGLDTSTWTVDKDDIEEEILVPYGDKSDMNTAMELSEAIFEKGGDENQWTMTRLERKSEAELREQEFMKRQYTLFGEEPEEDPIWDEWNVYWEDSEDAE